MDQQAGKYLIIAGFCILIAGVAVYFFFDYFKWLGKLPGDIRIVKGNFRFYFPIVTMVIISVTITIFIKVIRRLF